MDKYNFIVYQNETGFVQQITNTPAPNLPMIPEEDGVTAVHVNFYNPEIVDRYFVEGKFYEDAELTIEITDPANFTVPYIPPEPSEEEDITQSEPYLAGYDQAVLDMMGV